MSFYRNLHCDSFSITFVNNTFHLSPIFCINKFPLSVSKVKILGKLFWMKIR